MYLALSVQSWEENLTTSADKGLKATEVSFYLAGQITTCIKLLNCVLNTWSKIG